jgi:hypothetical protein
VKSIVETSLLHSKWVHRGHIGCLDGKWARFASAVVRMNGDRSVKAQAIVALENNRQESQDQVRSQRYRESEQPDFNN